MPKKKTQAKTRNMRELLPWLILAALAVLVYANTISHDYALDDIYAVSQNTYTKQGFAGIDDLLSKHFFAGYLGEQEVKLTGGRYRPLSLVTFAMEYEFFGENPHLSHLINILLFALLVVMSFRVFQRIFPEKGVPWYYSAVFIGMLLYTLHPVHTEVVANIKGRDEILATLFVMLALGESVKMKGRLQLKGSLLMMLYLFLALMSKENAIAFVLIIPMSLFFMGIKNWKPLLSNMGLLFLPFFAFMLIRLAVLGSFSTETSTELMDNPFLHASLGERYGTIFRTFGDYYRLMVYPAVLTWDYYPYHIPLTPLLSQHSLLPLAVTVALLVFAFSRLKKRSMDAYGILFYFISFFLVSNLVFNVGAFMAERFIFMPSLGLCLALGYGAYVLREKLSPAKKALVPILILVMAAYFSYRTYSRNQVWKDDFTLYTHDVLVSANSAKSNNIAAKFYAYEATQVGETPLKKQYFDKALFHFRRAIEIHPEFMDAWFHYGNTWYSARQNIDSLLYCYSRVLDLDPDEPNVWRNLEGLSKSGEAENRIKVLRLMIQRQPQNPKHHLELGRILISEERSEEAIPMLLKATELNPDLAEAWDFLGVIRYQERDYAAAEKAFRKALKLQPGNDRHVQNLAATLFKLGRAGEARELMRQNQVKGQ